MTTKLFKVFFLAFFLVVSNSCNKDIDPVKPDDKPSEISLLMDQNEAYQYTTIIIEATKPVESFNNKVSIDGVETSAGVVEGKYIAFTIQPTITSGSKKVKLNVNNKDFEFPLLVKELPSVTDPKATYSGYLDFMETLGENTGTAIKEAYANANIPIDPQIASIEAEIKILNDSLSAYETKFNKLSAEEQMIAAKFMAAHKLKMQPVYDFMEAHSEFIKDPLGFKKRSGICQIDGNMSASWICVLNETRKNTAILMKECIVNSILGGATGAFIGTILGPAGTTAGAYLGLATFQILNAKLILEYGKTLITNFGSAAVVTANEVISRKTSITYINGEEKAIEVNIKRRNMQAIDANSTVADLAAYIKTTQAFIDYVKTNFSKYVKTVPSFKSERNASTKLEKMEFVSVEVANNTKVKFEGMIGTPGDMKLKFSTNEITDQVFEYKVKYDDGVYKMETTQSGVLKSDIKLTLRDTTVGAKSSVINFKVEAPENTTWTLSDNADWMFTTVINGKGTQNVQLSVQDNLGTEKRIGSVSLSVDGNIIKNIKIEQNQEADIYGKWFFIGKNSYAIISDGSFAAYTADGTLDDSGTYDKIKNEVVIQGSDELVTFNVTTLTKTNLTLTNYKYNEVLSFERR